jgi:chemotaxis protein methyltransferase CheR
MTDFDRCLADIIESHSGLQVTGTHSVCVRSYAERRMKELDCSAEGYCQYLVKMPEELSLLIDEAAINETYFFREERQFEYLRDQVFPRYQGKKIIIWSACCSTGEEAVSLAVLAKWCGIDAEVYASDIDISALSVLRGGIYSRESFRIDGSCFHSLLELYGTRNGKSYTVSSDILSALHITEYNLSSCTAEPVTEASVDIIFMRNVFIYFNKDMRNRIFSRIARFIKPGGLLFFSMNEIAGVSAAGSGVPLVKEHCGSVYYFRKRDTDSPPVPKKITRHGADRKNNPEKKVPVPVSLRKPVTERLSEKKISVYEAGSHIIEALNSRDIVCSRRLLETSERSPSDLEYWLYYEGLVLKEEGNRIQAVSLFLKASLLNPAFWPAFLQLGLLYEEQGNEKEAVKAFSRCAKILEKYIEQQESCYNFLVESFSPSYFHTLCTIYIEKGKKNAD